MPRSTIASQTVYEEQTQGRATLVGTLKTWAPTRAAFAGGFAIHGFEFDDFGNSGPRGTSGDALRNCGAVEGIAW